MGVLHFFTVYLIGEDFKIPKWDLIKWVILFYHSCILFVFIQKILLLKIVISMLEYIQNSRLFIKCVYRMEVFFSFIPILGGRLNKVLNYFDKTLNNNILPFLYQLEKILPIMVHVILIKICFLENSNIKILFTEESEDMLFFCEECLLTILILSNHRSLNDYMLITYLILYGSGILKESDTLVDSFLLLWENNQTSFNIHSIFLSWGAIYQIPTKRLLKNIIFKDETVTMSSEDINQFIRSRGNRVFLLFPEVNILTTELAMIQRKLNNDYHPFVNKYYNVLSPRFQQFINILKGFKEVTYSSSSLSKTNKTCQKQKEDNNNDNHKVSLNEEGNEIKLNRPLVTRKESQSILFNKFIYDITIVYYSPVLVTKGHNHDTGDLKPINGIQINEINPSFFRLFRCKFDTEEDNTSPIIIVIDIKRHPLTPLLKMREKKLEKWLEIQWIRKEKLIDSLHSKIVIE